MRDTRKKSKSRGKYQRVAVSSSKLSFMIHTVRAEMVANVLEVSVAAGDRISIGETLLLLESMKMEIPVLAEISGEVREVAVAVGDVIQEGDPLVLIDEQARSASNQATSNQATSSHSASSHSASSQRGSNQS